ncbi:uncharacterized protein [Elaeis guineensis]|uniref:uncharacterized protein n=1 Tax=Elaeis guineensis var. tenera TaxID=51953 RepID=UPI003C6CD8FD
MMFPCCFPLTPLPTLSDFGEDFFAEFMDSQTTQERDCSGSIVEFVVDINVRLIPFFPRALIHLPPPFPSLISSADPVSSPPPAPRPPSTRIRRPRLTAVCRSPLLPRPSTPHPRCRSCTPSAGSSHPTGPPPLPLPAAIFPSRFPSIAVHFCLDFVWRRLIRVRPIQFRPKERKSSPSSNIDAVSGRSSSSIGSTAWKPQNPRNPQIESSRLSIWIKLGQVSLSTTPQVNISEFLIYQRRANHNIRPNARIEQRWLVELFPMWLSNQVTSCVAGDDMLVCSSSFHRQRPVRLLQHSSLRPVQLHSILSPVLHHQHSTILLFISQMMRYTCRVYIVFHVNFFYFILCIFMI